MSKRHHATRRRAYGRRQHELHQRGSGRFLAAWQELPEERPAAPQPADEVAEEEGRLRLRAVGFGD